MEAFTCDQVSINPITFSSIFSEVLRSLGTGHIIASNQKFKEKRHFVTCVTGFPTKHMQLQSLLIFLVRLPLFCHPALMFMFRYSFVLHPPTV